MLRGLMINLVEHGRITTTVEKAKELRRHIEKAITMGKKGDLNSRRLLISRIANPGTVSAIISDISPRFQSRPGGYTRIIKIGRRPGDTAEMAFIEFVDYDYTKAGAAKTVAAAAEGEGTGKKKSGKASEKAAAKSALAEKSAMAKKTVRLLAAKRKSVKKIQKKSRQASRA